MLERTGMKELSNRTATFTDSVIRRMTRISNKYGAVNLSQGFPDFDPPAQLLNSLSTIAADPKPLYTSTPSPGAPRPCARRSPPNRSTLWACR